MVPMGFGLYKPGQGYWVRVLTASFAGVLLLAAGAWLWTQLQGASGLIPHPTWTITVASPSGQAQPGQRIGFQRATQNPEDDAAIGTAVVKVAQDLSNGSKRLLVQNVSMNAGRHLNEAVSVAPAEGGANLAGSVIGAIPNPLFQPLYLQAAGVGLLLLLGSLGIYWLVGVRPSTSEFLISTDGEMKKVNWSSRKDIIGSTQVVIVWSLLIAAGLYLVDNVFAQFFTLVGVLKGPH
jgi:preprotein translocase SecE subunit